MTGVQRRIHFNDPLWILPRILTKLHTLWVAAVYPFAYRGKKFSIHSSCDLANTGLIHMGSYVTLHRDVWLHAHSSQENAEGRPVLVIRDNTFIGRRTHISAKNGIEIGAGVVIAASVLIQDHGHSFEDITRPIGEQGDAPGGRIRIGAGSWIGQGAAIICDAGELTIGENCVIGANAVVTRSAPPFSVISGNPARVVKQFDAASHKWVLGSVQRIG